MKEPRWHCSDCQFKCHLKSELLEHLEKEHPKKYILGKNVVDKMWEKNLTSNRTLLELMKPVKEEHGSRKVFPNLKKHYSKKLNMVKNEISAQSHIFNSKEDSYDGVEKSAFSKITDLSGYFSKLHRARGISVPIPLP